MSHLLRQHAPITSETWELLDSEAVARLTPVLGARRFVDFAGPLGWQHSATNLGRVSAALTTPADGVTATRRQVLPLAEVRAPFSLSRAELDAASRGAADVDLSPLDDAAFQIATVENVAVFDGWSQLGMTGIRQATPHQPIATGDDPNRLAITVAAAVATLQKSGVAGSYGLALDYDSWINATGGNDLGGAPLVTHLRRILDGPVAWVPGISEPVVVSLRGGDFILECGQDLAIGYSSHTADSVEFYLEETFSFRVATPEAAVALT